MYQVRKYKAFGEWSEWKTVDEQTAKRKARVTVKAWVGDDAPYGGFEQCHPYQVREVEG